MRNISLLLIALFISAVALNAEIITVNWDGSGDYTTIQEGINASSNGDTVLVADGTYTGENNKNLSWDGNEKHIVVKSENGADNCIIDCEEDGRGFDFDGTNQDTTDVIDGFTIKNGYSGRGGGIFCNNASPCIKNNIINNNVVEGSFGGGSGGGIGCISSSTIIINNLIKNNSALYVGFPGAAFGGGISIVYGAPIVKYNIIKNNETSAIDMESSVEGAGLHILCSSAKVKNNLIIGNTAYHQGYGWSSGGGICSGILGYNCTIIENNTIVNNFADYGGGIRCSRYTIVRNNICCNNSQDGMNCYGLADSSIISHNDVWGNNQNFVSCPPGIGDTSWGINVNGTPCDSCYNISENPLFISGPDGNYYLSQIEAGQALQSPCVDAGDSTAYYYGLENYTTRTDLVADTGVVDIGYHYPWGIVVSIDNNILEKPEIYLTNFPNPFSSSTTIFFDLATDLHRLALIKIYNIKGQLVKTLECINRVNAKATRSLYSISWKGSDENDKQLSNGIYLYQLKLDNYKSEIKKMILIR